jgi:hypothetical protein
MMFGLLDYLKIGAGLAAGLALMLGFNALIHDPMIEREARQGYVLEAQKTALEAQLAERDRQIKAGEYIITAYQQQLSNARAAETARAEQSEQEIAAYEKRLADEGRICRLDGADIDWLRKP